MNTFTPLLNSQEAANALRITPQTFLRKIKDGSIRASYLSGQYFVRPADIEAYVNKHYLTS